MMLLMQGLLPLGSCVFLPFLFLHGRSMKPFTLHRRLLPQGFQWDVKSFRVGQAELVDFLRVMKDKPMKRMGFS